MRELFMPTIYIVFSPQWDNGTIEAFSEERFAISRIKVLEEKDRLFRANNPKFAPMQFFWTEIIVDLQTDWPRTHVLVEGMDSRATD